MSLLDQLRTQISAPALPQPDAAKPPPAPEAARPPRPVKVVTPVIDEAGGDDESGGGPADALRPVVRSETPTFQGPGPQPPQGPILERREPREDKRWHVVVDGRDGGPVDFSEIRARVIAGVYSANTFLFRPGMTTSVRLETIEGLAKHLPRATAATSAPPSAAQQLKAEAPKPPPLPATAGVASSPPAATVPALWWWLNPIIPGDPFRGPFSFSEVQGMWANGELSSSTMVHRSDRPADYWSAISNDERLIHEMPHLSPSPTRDWSVWIGDVSTPFCFRELETAVRERRINGDTYVMHPQHAPHWAALSSVVALRQLHKLLEHLGPAAAPALPAEHQRWAPPAASSQSGPPAPPGGTPAQQPVGAPSVIPPSQYQYLRFCTTCKAPLAPYPGNRYCQVDTCRAKQY